MCAKSFVGNEPFAILYGDDVIINNEYPVTKQLCDVFLSPIFIPITMIRKW